MYLCYLLNKMIKLKYVLCVKLKCNAPFYIEKKFNYSDFRYYYISWVEWGVTIGIRAGRSVRPSC